MGQAAASRAHPNKAVKVVSADSITASSPSDFFFLLPFVRIFTKLTGKQVVKEIDVNESVAVPSSGLQARERKRPCEAMQLVIAL